MADSSHELSDLKNHSFNILLSDFRGQLLLLCGVVDLQAEQIRAKTQLWFLSVRSKSFLVDNLAASSREHSTR